MQVKRPLSLISAALKPARRSGSRRGVSILEVLFAIMVTTIGLLGAIAVFPVASAQARKGRISDAMAVAGMSAAHDFDIRGMRQAVNWRTFDGSGNLISPHKQQESGTKWFNGAEMFCLDPRYFAANSTEVIKARTFPADTTGGLTRITLPGIDAAANKQFMKLPIAEAIFMFDDDLTFGRPDDRSLNAYQLMDQIETSAGSGIYTQYKRQSDGHMSWMATIVPKLDRNSTDFKDTYLLSIVIFYDRPMDDLASSSLSSEIMFTIGKGATAFPGAGVTGGEVLLKGTEGALNQLKAGDWIMLRASSAPAARWYRIVDVDADAESNGTNFQRYVTLFGQDWDSTLDTNAFYAEGVIGVYEKTIRLDMTP